MIVNDRPVTLEELAGVLGVRHEKLKPLVQRGILTRAKRGAYPLGESIRAYCTHLRETAAGRAHVNVGSGLALERERETRARADSLELKLAAQRGELLPAAQVEAMWGDVLRLIRARVLATPGRLQQQLAHLTPHDVATIDRELRDTLTELSDDPL